MPVTAKLSRKFYDRLGDDVASKPVEWLNSVDASNRQEFRDLFEAHFGRLEARLQQGPAEVRGELGTMIEANSFRLILWSFGFWAASLAVMLGILRFAGVSRRRSERLAGSIDLQRLEVSPVPGLEMWLPRSMKWARRGCSRAPLLALCCYCLHHAV